jgi:hypothetical protein
MNLESRVEKLESLAGRVDMKAMSDDQLDAHAKTLTFASAEQYRAILTLVLRHRSAFPVKH